jgi:large subunit ribosomal protein L6
MSRIGKKPIEIIDGVEAKVSGHEISIKGPKGELSFVVEPEIKIEINDKNILVFPKSLEKNKQGRISKRESALWGLSRALISNMMNGVKNGYEKKLEIEGVGFRAEVEGKNLSLKIGFTHLVKIEAPKGIEFKVEKNVIIVSGVDKQKVGEIAAKIRKAKPAEPYKGKGIKYAGEIIRRKAGKKAITSK